MTEVGRGLTLEGDPESLGVMAVFGILTVVVVTGLDMLVKTQRTAPKECILLHAEYTSVNPTLKEALVPLL